MIVDLIKLNRGTTLACDAKTPADGEPIWDTDKSQLRMGDGVSAGGTNVAMEDVGVARIMHFNDFQYPDAANDWHCHGAYAHLHQNKATKTFWIHLAGLKAGDIITAYTLMGDAALAAALTLDCKLVRANLADPITTTDITNGVIMQVTADGLFRAAANPDDTTAATDKQYYLEVTGTTGTGDEIFVTGVEVNITRLP